MHGISAPSKFILVALFLGAVSLGPFSQPPMANAQDTLPLAFTLLGPDGVVARVITMSETCPPLIADGNQIGSTPRFTPDDAFPVRVCDAVVPAGTTSASMAGQELKLGKARPERITIVGDTGCRMKGESMQACNDPVAWPWATVAANAAKTNPDVIIHVGDYHYRESPCIVDKANCAGSPYGDNWVTWNADLFTPGRDLLQTAPWVVVRGNHEDCKRAGDGYFRLMDPRPMPKTCPTYTDPFALDYIEPRLLVLDNSAVNDYEVQADQLAAYKPQLEKMNELAGDEAWWLQHDPMYAFGPAGAKDGVQQLFQDQPTLQQADSNTYAPGVQMFLSGHLHSFGVYSFDEGRPPQLMVGNGGTNLDAEITVPLTGLEIAGMNLAYGLNHAKFGFTVMDRMGDKWALGVKNVEGGEMDKCVLGGGTLLCGQAPMPTAGSGFENRAQWWLVVALLGGAILLGGLALRMRGWVAPSNHS